ncbi:MAG TPA: porin [Methyloceanibacter sp.]|nr:porin [Methyloceanibacter sp.]
MKLQKTHLAAAVGVALSAFGSVAVAQAPAPAPMSVQLYGQVTRALLNADDGTQNKWFHVDNEASGTRLGATGTGQVMPGLRAGFRIEFDFQSNESQRVTFGTASAPGIVSNFPAHVSGAGFSERHADAWVEGAWGRVNIGQGDGAANGATESDLSGTGLANGIGVADLGGGFAHRTSAGVLTNTTIGGAINQQDFESRYDRLMYVTPNFAGIRGQVSWGQNANTDIKEASLWYGGKLGGLGEIAAAIGWSEQGAAAPGAAKDETIGGSISWLHGSGLNVTLSYSNRDNPVAAGAAGRDSTFTYAKVGWKFGTHAIAVDYAMGEDFLAVGDEAKMYGIGYVWNPVRFLEIYAAYKIHEMELGVGGGTSLEDVKIGTIGTRVRF